MHYNFMDITTCIVSVSIRWYCDTWTYCSLYLSVTNNPLVAVDDLSVVRCTYPLVVAPHHDTRDLLGSIAKSARGVMKDEGAPDESVRVWRECGECGECGESVREWRECERQKASCIIGGDGGRS
jgi:hypothetical protein